MNNKSIGFWSSPPASSNELGVMLPLNSEGEAPTRKHPWGSSNDDGEVLRNQEEIVRFGKTSSKPGRYAVVRYRHVRTRYGERFEAHAWPRPGGWHRQKPYESSAFNKVEVYVEPGMQCAWLGPKGWIIVSDEYRGEGLGSYLLCGVLTWLKEHYPNYEVTVGWLSPGDGTDPTNRTRRDAFYRRQGFSLFYDNFETADGAFWAPAASALTPYWNTQKVERLSAWQAVDLLLEQDDQLRDVTSRFETIKR